MQKGAFRLFAGMIVLMFMAGGVAHAGTKTLKCSSSGSGVNAPGDLDADSCFTAVNGATVCTDTSASSNFSGDCSPGGRFTGQNLVEYDLVSGTGCNIVGIGSVPFASCKLTATSEQGCLAQSVGGNEVDRDSPSGDLVFSTVSSTTLCLDLSSGPPFNFTGSATSTITGGTGKNAGATGTFNATFHGQILSSDPAGHGLSWFVGSSSGTITTP